jgi:hypothetical protein
MWTYTAYLLSKYLEKFHKDRLEIYELAHHFLISLWENGKVMFHEDVKDLLNDFKYLAEERKAIGIKRNADSGKTYIIIKDREELNKIATGLVKFVFSKKSEIPLLLEFIEAIDKTVENIQPIKSDLKAVRIVEETVDEMFFRKRYSKNFG